MIRREKLDSALFALQGVLICARELAYRCARNEGTTEVGELADLLDRTEYLPSLIASKDDETVAFRKALEAIAARHGCRSAVTKFDGDAPTARTLSGSSSPAPGS